MIIFAVPALYDRVAARFAAEATNVPMYYGWKEAATQVRDSARLVWVPGDPSGNLGRIGPPKYPSRDQLLTLFEYVTIHGTAAEASDLTDSRAQYQRSRELLDALLRAVHLEAVGTYTVLQNLWYGMHADVTRRWGASWKVVLEVQSPIVNDPVSYESVLMDAAEIEAHELDHSETVLVERE